ncbi:winged helix-turn-helix domain-containing protein [Micromonospora sp. H33]|uniref:winged helix family transcriptional regulator n=1 Tax=Micromonospora sp. H33 TaxID=3452215 RepID=UPI003F89B092
MSVVALPVRTPPAARPDGTGPPRSRSRATVTVTVDLAAGPLSPRVVRLLDLLGELAESGEGRLESGEGRVPAPVAEPRRAEAHPDAVTILAGSRVVRHRGRVVPLTRIEYDLLLFLAERPRTVFTRLQLLAAVWGYEHAVVRTVDVHVRRLRAKLDTAIVTTVHGVGYRLADEAHVLVAHSY